jgi:hypothetical protein
VLVDSSNAQQFDVVGTTLKSVETGVGNTALFAAAQRGADRLRPWRARPFVPLAVSHWHAVIAKPGTYRVLVYIPYALSGLIDSDGVFYQIIHQHGISEVAVNMQSVANEWVDLGTYQFDGSSDVLLPMRDAIGDRGVWADAGIVATRPRSNAMNPVEVFPTHVTDGYEALRVVASRWCDAQGDSVILDAAVPKLATLVNASRA